MGVVYKIPCSCDAFYIGETGRQLKTRISEHKLSVSKKDAKSALCEHTLTHPEHSIQWDKVEKLTINQNNAVKRKYIEAIQIRRLRPIINRDQGFDIHRAYQHLIL